MKKGNNKGEWSELYAFLKILEKRKIPAADKNLEIIDGKYFLFLKIFKGEGEEKKVYDMSKSETEVFITDASGALLKEFDSRSLSEKTLRIFEKMKNNEVKSGSFDMPEAREVMDELLCTKVKANNSHKTDLTAMVYDCISDMEPILGFSIKSMVGGAATLFNAGPTTNFVYEIEGFEGSIDEVNAITEGSYIRDRVQKILQSKGCFKFVGVCNEQFEANMKMFDTALPSFMAYMVFDYFSNSHRTVVDLVKDLSEDEGMQRKYGLSYEAYEYKIKNFLDAAALGMVASKPWDGIADAQGGCIVVKENGDVVCYHLYNRDEFRAYLYENTKLEGASASRYGFGELYEKNGKLYFKLNLQIRFLK